MYLIVPQAMERVQGLMESQGKLSDMEQQVADLQRAVQGKVEESEREAQLHRRYRCVWFFPACTNFMYKNSVH